MSEMYRQLQELIRLKVITKCDTMPKFLSPVIMVMQKNKIRMCTNYKALNSLCRSRAYCMADLHSHIDDLKGFKFYASFDLMKCYNQFGIKENDRSYAAFSTPFGNFMFFFKLLVKIIPGTDARVRSYRNCIYFSASTFVHFLVKMRV
jgi:hypothetical protein